MILLDGKKASDFYAQRLRQEAINIYKQRGYKPSLKIVLLGNRPESKIYVQNKLKKCEQLAINASCVRFAETMSEGELVKKVQKINEDASVDGLIVQMPLPPHIAPNRVIDCIFARKDVDGLTPQNMGNLAKNNSKLISATPLGIQMLLSHYQIPIEGKNIAIVGRSNIVGRPLSLLLSGSQPFGNATVTLCHSKTADIASITNRADLVVVALGIPKFLKADMVKKGVVVIDVGINRVVNSNTIRGYSIVGDVDFQPVSQKASAITPVPGGVGPMTIIGLLSNTIKAAQLGMEKN